MRDLSKKTFQISLGAMLTVLSLLLLYCAALLPAGRVTLYFLSSLMLAPLLYERQPRAAFFDEQCAKNGLFLRARCVIMSIWYIDHKRFVKNKTCVGGDRT